MSTAPPSGNFRGRLGPLVVYLFVSLVLSLVLVHVRDEPGMTLVYRTAAERLVRGEQFYRPEDRMAFTYPPLFVLAYLPLVYLPESAARAVWYFVNFCLLSAVVRLTVRMAAPMMRERPGRGPWRGLVTWVLIGVLSVRFVISPIEYQSHDLIVYLLVMLAIAAWSAGAEGRAGGWAGIAAACKATPLLFLPVFLWQGRLRAALALGVVAALATLLPDLISRNPDAPLWAVSWHEKFVSKVDAGAAPKAEGAWASWNMLNQSLSGTLHRLGTPVEKPSEFVWDVCVYPLSPPQLARLVIGLKVGVLGLVLLITWPGRLRRMDPPERAFCTLGQGAAILCAMLLVSPMTSKQHFCVLLAPLTFCGVDFVWRRRDPAVGAALGIVFFLGALAGRDVVGQAIHRQLAAYGSLTWCTVALLVASAYVVVGRDRASRRASEEATCPPSGATIRHQALDPRRPGTAVEALPRA